MFNSSTWEFYTHRNFMPWDHPAFLTGIGFLTIWSLVWSGLALWKSARNNDRYWFIAFLLIHTAGILEILYLFVFAKNKFVLVSEPSDSTKTNSRKK